MIGKRKSIVFSAFAIGLLALAGCTPERPAPGAERDAAGTSIHAAPTATQSVRGLYSWGAEVESLQPCGQSVVWWVNGSQSLRAPLHAKADERRAAEPTNPYPLIYVEGQGRLLGKAGGGFAADYDNVIELTSVSRIEAPPPADCRQPKPD